MSLVETEKGRMSGEARPKKEEGMSSANAMAEEREVLFDTSKKAGV